MKASADVAHGRLAATGTCSNIDSQTHEENIFGSIRGESSFEGLFDVGAPVGTVKIVNKALLGGNGILPHIIIQ